MNKSEIEKKKNGTILLNNNFFFLFFFEFSQFFNTKELFFATFVGHLRESMLVTTLACYLDGIYMYLKKAIFSHQVASPKSILNSHECWYLTMIYKVNLVQPHTA